MMTVFYLFGCRLHMHCYRLILVMLLSSCLLGSPSNAIQFLLSSGQERCISEDANVGDLLRLDYLIKPFGTSSSVVLTDPFQARLYTKEMASTLTPEEKLRYVYTTNKAGEFKVCFTNYNRDGRTQQQTIDVALKISSGLSDTPEIGGSGAKKQALKPMEQKLQQLVQTVTQIQQEQKALSDKEQTMMEYNTSTSSRVMVFSVLSTVLLVGLKGAEIIYLRSYFKSRRMIQ